MLNLLVPIISPLHSAHFRSSVHPSYSAEHAGSSEGLSGSRQYQRRLPTHAAGESDGARATGPPPRGGLGGHGLMKHALQLGIHRGRLSRSNDGVGAAIRMEPCLISAWTLAEPPNL